MNTVQDVWKRRLVSSFVAVEHWRNTARKSGVAEEAIAGAWFRHVPLSDADTLTLCDYAERRGGSSLRRVATQVRAVLQPLDGQAPVTALTRENAVELVKQVRAKRAKA